MRYYYISVILSILFFYAMYMLIIEFLFFHICAKMHIIYRWFAECNNAFHCRVFVDVMRMTNDHERVDRVLACHVRAGLYKWIASPGPYLTGIRNINGQMRFCRREWMARGRVSIYSRRTILSRRRYVAKPLRRKHFDYFFCEKCFRNRTSIVHPTTLLEKKLIWLIYGTKIIYQVTNILCGNEWDTYIKL